MTTNLCSIQNISDGISEILSGLAPCALVVVQGQTQLHDARKITVAAPSEP